MKTRIFSSLDDRPFLESPPFSPPNNANLQFSLRLCPKRVFKTQDKDHVSLFLKRRTCPKAEIRVKCEFSIIDRQGSKRNTKAFSHNFDLKSSDFGFWNFVKHEKLNSLLTDDKLTIYCEVKALLDTINTIGCSTVCDNQIESHLSACYGHLLESRLLSDVVLMAGRDSAKTKHLAHRAILAARSRVFAAMFEHKTKELKTSGVLIEDIEGDVLEEMLRFIYTGKVHNLAQNAEGLLIAADKYQLDPLKDTCEKYLVANLNSETVITLLIIADRHLAPLLRSKSIEYINSNLATIIETDNWQTIKDMPELYFELLTKIMVDNLQK